MKAVHVQTQAEYDVLMRAYEARGWLWKGYKPTQIGIWSVYKDQTCVSFENNFLAEGGVINWDNFGYCEKKWYLDQGYEIITLEQALKELKQAGYKRYTPEDTIEINGKKYKAVE